MSRKNLFIGLLLAALAAGFGWLALRERPQEQPPLSFAPPENPGECYFNWATQQLPVLSEQVQAAMQEVQPGAQARAEAYGEDCIYQDGHADFHAMETDCHLTLQTADLNDTEEFGLLIRKSMDLLLERFPTGQTPGPQPGLVAFRFQSSGEEKNLQVQVTDFQKLPPELTGSELFQALLPTP